MMRCLLVRGKRVREQQLRKFTLPVGHNSLRVLTGLLIMLHGEHEDSYLVSFLRIILHLQALPEVH